MNLTRRSLFAHSAAFALLPGAAHAKWDPPVVFAASSLKTVLDEVGEVFPQYPMLVSYGGSGALARQINLGAEVELFISANSAWAALVEDAPVTHATPRSKFLSNRLVLIAPTGTPPISLGEIPTDAKIAMGFVNAVPAGQYGKAAFEALGLWDALKPRVIETDSVRLALAYVARGEVPFGVVYATDALAQPRVDVVAEFPAETHPPIVYEMVIPAGGSWPDGLDTMGLLQSTEAKAIYQKHGFGVLF